MSEPRYQPRYVGFYWTLPVRWRGFTNLSSNVDEAVTQSRTIHYQRALATRHVGSNVGRMVDEVVYMEVDPEHGTPHVTDALNRAERSCREHDAKLLWVDFQRRSGWRGHIHINGFILKTGVPNEPLFPDSLMIGDEYFDPVKHFRNWRALNAISAEHRRHEIEFGLAAALERIPPGYGRNPKIAAFLNEKGICTQNGLPWSAENVAKAVKNFTTQTINEHAPDQAGDLL